MAVSMYTHIECLVLLGKSALFQGFLNAGKLGLYCTAYFHISFNL